MREPYLSSNPVPPDDRKKLVDTIYQALGDVIYGNVKEQWKSKAEPIKIGRTDFIGSTVDFHCCFALLSNKGIVIRCGTDTVD